uniref:Calpain 9 n=1 Tax=Varanus komodoensis TaxID=61221 RepID=A0A8D2LUA4_VARKO
MPYLYRDSSPRAPAVPKNARPTHSTGQTYKELKAECQQKGMLFEDCDFPANDTSLFYSEKPPVPFVWKRPGEIVKDPQFIVGGATRTDICQGDLGDCWLLAAIASLTLNESTLARVVPPDQDFGPGYAGIFHFQFWQHNEWLDIVIDDRLPTFKDRLVFLHSADHNEFWSALLEKAYAKLNGSYEALKGGSTIEAMEDFTGGVGEMFELKKSPENYYEILGKALKRGSMVGCSIDISNAAETEARTPYGLIKGHAYSVTGIDEINYQGRKVKLIRIRNPWGQVEWNGAWSDNSPEWRSVSPSEKKRLYQTALDDGEFWMEFEDFLSHFDKVEICNLTPDALEDKTMHKWEVTVHQGSWVRGATAGGCRNFIETFWTNPQFRLQLSEKDDGQNECTFIAALMQKDRRKLKKLGAEMLTIGYAIYESPSKEEQLTKDFFRYHSSKARSKTYINLREVSDRFSLPPGNYIVIPTTFEPHQEADFCLRIFSEKKAVTKEVDGNVNIDLPELPEPTSPQQETEEEKQFRALFKQIAGQDMEISAEELQYILNAVLKKSNGNGKLEFNEFKIFWDKLKNWISIFLHFDSDQSGTMSSYELRLALKAAGFQLNNYLLQLIVLRYSDDQYQIEFDDFLNSLIRLENASRVFQALNAKNRDFINLNISEVIALKTQNRSVLN